MKPLSLVILVLALVGAGGQNVDRRSQDEGTVTGAGHPGPVLGATTPAGYVAAVRPGTSGRHHRAIALGGSVPALAAVRVVRGIASHVGTQYGRRYLALPEHRWGRPGIRVTICGAGGCITRTSTDAGPDKAMQRAGRVADLNAWDFAKVCGCPASRGTTRVTVQYGNLPNTDMEGTP